MKRSPRATARSGSLVIEVSATLSERCSLLTMTENLERLLELLRFKNTREYVEAAGLEAMEAAVRFALQGLR